jgi:hypothetical protein
MKNSTLFTFGILLSLLLTVNIFSQSSTDENKPKTMHRYVVERTFPDGLEIPINSEGQYMCLNVVLNNSEEQVTWVHSYVTMDKKKTFCIYDAPSAEAIERVAEMNGLPVDNIIEVSVLDPYFYK